jgi:hypothetical protein
MEFLKKICHGLSRGTQFLERLFCYRINPHISQATCYEAGKHCVYFVPLEKHPQHTDSMPPGDFLRAPRIRNPLQLLATIFVKYAG